MDEYVLRELMGQLKAAKFLLTDVKDTLDIDYNYRQD